MRKPAARRTARRTTLTDGMVALAVAGTGTTVKVRQQDVDRMEVYTGKMVEELSEEEFNRAMDDLDVKEQEWSDQDLRSIEEGPSASYLNELERLAELKEKGILTEEEFEAKKKEILKS